MELKVRLFEELYEAWLRESEEQELRPLKGDFYRRLAKYLRKLEEEAKSLDEKSLKGRIKAKEFERAKKLASDLINLRFKKISNQVLAHGRSPEKSSLAEEELEIYSKMREAYLAAERLLNRIISGEEELSQPGDLVLVRFLKDVPSLVDSSLKIYGPFKAEDVARLPREIAEGLIRQNLAKEVKAS